MIAKCVVVLAIVAQIRAELCSSNYAASPVLSSNLGTGYSAEISGGLSLKSASPSGRTRNLVAKGKYPIALENPGPALDGRIPVTSSHVQTPVQEKPTVRLPAVIPSQKTVAHSCTCYKTILRPRVHQQVITVPSVQRYIETRHTPVVENIHYEAIPINSPDRFAIGNGYQNEYSGNVAAVASAPALAVSTPIMAVSSPIIASASPISAYSSNYNSF